MENAKNEFRQTVEGLVSFGEILTDLSTNEMPSKEGYLHLSRIYNLLIEGFEDKFESLKAV